jgi:hypothetical protein
MASANPLRQGSSADSLVMRRLLAVQQQQQPQASEDSAATPTPRASENGGNSPCLPTGVFKNLKALTRFLCAERPHQDGCLGVPQSAGRGLALAQRAPLARLSLSRWWLRASRVAQMRRRVTAAHSARCHATSGRRWARPTTWPPNCCWARGTGRRRTGGRSVPSCTSLSPAARPSMQTRQR